MIYTVLSLKGDALHASGYIFNKLLVLFMVEVEYVIVVGAVLALQGIAKVAYDHRGLHNLMEEHLGHLGRMFRAYGDRGLLIVNASTVALRVENNFVGYSANKNALR